MKYLILVTLLLALKSDAHNWIQWLEVNLICEVRTVKPVTYGAN